MIMAVFILSITVFILLMIIGLKDKKYYLGKVVSKQKIAMEGFPGRHYYSFIILSGHKTNTIDVSAIVYEKYAVGDNFCIN